MGYYLIIILYTHETVTYNLCIFRILTNIPSKLMPSFWFQQTADLSKDLATQTKLLLVAPSAGVYTGYGFIGIGILLIIVGGVVTYRRGWKQSEEEPLIK